VGRTCTAVLAATVVILLLAGPAGAAPEPGLAPVQYQAPVPGPIVDPYRPPVTPYGPGNRGVDYATTPGEAVGAPADGVVTFAGPMAGGLHVVLLHRDGIRTSLSFLAAVLVARGQVVERGQPVGRAGATLHLGARQGEAYFDPTTLFPTADRGAERSVLVPEGPSRPLGAEEEAAGLGRLLAGTTPRPGLPTAADLAAAIRVATARGAVAVEAAAEAAAAFGAPGAWSALAVTAAAQGEQGPCTPAATPPPPRPTGRRQLVLVGGLGSASGDAAAFEVDVAALGYAPSDVVRFSYRGGTTAEAPYRAADTLLGIEAPAVRLATLLTRLATARPDRPVDIVAHSMGGLVARAALAHGRPPGTPAPATLVTLATPHGGADLAGIADQSTMSVAGSAVAQVLPATSSALAPASQSVGDLAPGSAFLTRLAAFPPPAPPTRVAAIGSRTDLVVPPPRARWSGVPSTTVDLDGVGVQAHDALPRSAAATREVALATAGAPPTCRSATDALVDAAVGLLVRAGTQQAGLAANVGLTGVLPVSPALAPVTGS